MTVELYRADPYRTEFVARVVRHEGDRVVLDQTCFFPRGRHAPVSDLGSLDSHDVVDVGWTTDHLVRHDLCGAKSHPIAVGRRMVGRVDWDRRYRSMRLHTAQHLAEIALRVTHDVSGISVAEVTDEQLALRVMMHGTLDVPAVEEWMSSTIRDDLPMLASEDIGPPHRWVWHLDGYGHRYCQALHVNSTGEIGAVHIKEGAEETAAIKLELELACSDRIAHRDRS